MVSSHKEVREALVENGIFFTLVYPEPSIKEEYIRVVLEEQVCCDKIIRCYLYINFH